MNKIVIDTNLQQNVLSDLTFEIKHRYLTDGNIINVLLERDKYKLKEHSMIDAVYQNILTSLQFGQYRKAVLYLVLFKRLCSRLFVVR